MLDRVVSGVRPTVLSVAGLVLGLVFCGVVFVGCGERAEGDGRSGGDHVVLYTSADTEFARMVVDSFTASTGISVSVVGDTEVTKTTGLVQRLIAERGRPRAHVWWSSEPFGTITLDREGLLVPYVSSAAEGLFEGEGWPEHLRGSGDSWYGFAQRFRVFVYNTDFVSDSDVPRTLWDLTDARFRGRVGIARPQFGTTRGHVGALLAAEGEERFVEWLEAMKANGVRVFDGNMTIVRAVGNGDIHIGLTDTDDVWVGKRNGWPVEMVFERVGDEVRRSGGYGSMIRDGFGPMVIPNTVGVVGDVDGRAVGGAAAERLVDFLLAGEAERVLAESDSRNWPVVPELRRAFAANGPPAELGDDGEALVVSLYPSLEAIAEAIPRALELIEEVWGDR